MYRGAVSAVSRLVRAPYRILRAATFVPRTAAMLLIWILSSVAVVSIHWYIVVYAAVRIACDVALFGVCVMVRRALNLISKVGLLLNQVRPRRATSRAAMTTAVPLVHSSSARARCAS